MVPNLHWSISSGLGLYTNFFLLIRSMCCPPGYSYIFFLINECSWSSQKLPKAVRMSHLLGALSGSESSCQYNVGPSGSRIRLPPWCRPLPPACPRTSATLATPLGGRGQGSVSGRLAYTTAIKHIDTKPIWFFSNKQWFPNGTYKLISVLNGFWNVAKCLMI